MKALRRNRGLLLVLLGVGLIGVVALLIPAPTTDDGPNGTSVLRRFLEDAGVEVRAAAEPGDTGETFFLPHDLRSEDQAGDLLDWVRSGGHLVVADPASAVVEEAGFVVADTLVGGFGPEQEIAAACLLPQATRAERIVVSPQDATFTPGHPEALGCFGTDGGTFLVARPYGEGEIVALGGLTPLTNAHLDDADDVALAWNLLGQGPVAFGGPVAQSEGVPGVSPITAGGERPGLWDLMPPVARAVVVQAAVAAVFLAVVRARRLGPPVEERLAAPIPASELVTASAELYRRSRSWAHAGEILRRRFRTRVGRRLGIGHGDSEEDLSEALSGVLGTKPSGIAPTEVGDERTLVISATRLETIERRLEGDAT